MDDLKLNTLNRFKKLSPELVLEQHGSCEVPAGCGGVVMRWVNPAREAQLSFLVFSTGEAELFLNGEQVSSSVFTVAMGHHVLALHLRNGAQFLLAVQRGSGQDQKLLFASRADDSWRATQEEPPTDWTRLDFSTLWDPLEKADFTADSRSFRREEAEKLGAEPIGKAGAGSLWVRKLFELAP